MEKRLVVFVHGWSTTDTSTYGGLPRRIVSEAAGIGLDITAHDIFLSKYVSFRDEVRVEDIARALEAAVRTELKELVAEHGRFIAITHSTGGPVVREWHRKHYVDKPRSGPCPMSHLVMLAPANFGSALAVLGKAKVGRIKAWAQGVEPGSGVLDWLQLGSDEAWDLNEWWIRSGADHIGGPRGIFPFVLTGQSIDRKLYDYVNSYTGESGSDGVVRVAAANLNAIHVQLEQVEPRDVGGAPVADRLSLKAPSIAPTTAMQVIPGVSHSGNDQGIMGSVSPDLGDKRGEAVVTAILDALRVRTVGQYDALTQDWAKTTVHVQKEKRLEPQARRVLPDTHYIHDPHSMIVVRVTDTAGHRIDDFDLILTGEEDKPGLLPQGFLSDRQLNDQSKAVTLFLNHAVMAGSEEIPKPTNSGQPKQLYRPKLDGITRIGMKVVPRPDEGFVHYLECSQRAVPSALKNFVKPNQTTIVDIVLQRVVHKGVFELVGLDDESQQGGFKDQEPGGVVA